MNQKYVVQLTDEQRQQLERLVSSGIAPARTIRRARILLKSDCGPGGPHWSYSQVSEALDVSSVTIGSVRKTFVLGGLEAALYRKKPEREYQRSLDGEAEAHLIALACSPSPEGHERWTLRLLQQKMVELEYVETVSHETIRATLKKTNSSRG